MHQRGKEWSKELNGCNILPKKNESFLIIFSKILKSPIKLKDLQSTQGG